MNHTTQQSDAWTPYAKKPKHPVPEPATFLAITLALLIVLAARWGRKSQ